MEEKPVTIRINPVLAAKLQALAVEERRSLSNLVNVMLEEAIKEIEGRKE